MAPRWRERGGPPTPYRSLSHFLHWQMLHQLQETVASVQRSRVSMEHTQITGVQPQTGLVGM